VPDSKLRLPKPQPTDHPVDVGQRTEAAILAELVRRGYTVLLPFGVNQRYDLVLEVDGEFVRAQCKTGRLRNGAVEFAVRSTRANMKTVVQRGYRGEADLFLVYCRELDRTYAVSVDEAPASNMYLRVEPPRNGQGRGIHPAEMYELPE
jgi:hypothetical protein